jgi:hypothetical protein
MISDLLTHKNYTVIDDGIYSSLHYYKDSPPLHSMTFEEARKELLKIIKYSKDEWDHAYKAIKDMNIYFHIQQFKEQYNLENLVINGTATEVIDELEKAIPALIREIERSKTHKRVLERDISRLTSNLLFWKEQVNQYLAS